MDIHIKIIPKNKHRPEVDGVDWFWDANGNLQVRVSPLGDWRYETLLGIHEACEAVLCKNNGVLQKFVDVWDQAYDAAHPNQPDLNAGDDPDAPYRREHCFATAIERIMAAELNVCWSDYDKTLAVLYPGPSKRERHKRNNCNSR